ncbi:hypothetical protein ABWH93_16915 [Seohaeicola saemankumensis]|uniref:hypothetical protein n=1 Tax=Seohaeicola TaxID=481178 RepID=UPI0035CF9915
MRLSIIIPDAMVVKNGMAHAGLDFASADIPATVHALQWMGTDGMIEHDDASVETITTLPLWAEIALDLWEAREAALRNPAPLSDEQRLSLAQMNRQQAYALEADPLFFKWQAGEGSREDWEIKRQEIRLRFPYPDEV